MHSKLTNLRTASTIDRAQDIVYVEAPTVVQCPDVGTRPPDSGGSHLDWLLVQIRTKLYLGHLSPGDRLPSVRELARRLRISPTTALELYRSLESEGLVEGRERSGVFVKAGPLAGEAHDRERSAFTLVTAVAKQAGQHGLSPAEFVRMLLRYTGAQRRHDFTVAFVGCRESFDLIDRQLTARLGFRLPVLHIPGGRSAAELRAALQSHPSIGCVLTAFLNVHHVSPMITELGLPLVPARLAPPAAAMFETPRSGRRYVVVRDLDMASYLRETACHLARIRGEPSCPPGVEEAGCRRCGVEEVRQAPGVSFAALQEDALLADFDVHAEVVHATVTSLDAVRTRYGHSKRIVPVVAPVSDDTIDALLFQYVCGPSRAHQSRAAITDVLSRPPAVRANG